MAVVDIFVPAEQEGTTAMVRGWLAKVGDFVNENDPLVELETDKVTQEVPAPLSGVLAEILLETDMVAEPGALLARMRPGPVGDSAVAADNELIAEVSATASAAEAPALSPSVRRALLAHALDPAAIAGTGRGGRITRQDVDDHVEQIAASSAQESALNPTLAKGIEPVQAAPLKLPSEGETRVRSVPHDRMRLAIAANMLASVTNAPHVTAVFECDFSAIIAHRGRAKADFAREGVNLTFTAYFIAASVAAMRVAPSINSRWYDERLDIYDDINIGVGTSLGDKGLIVPVVRNCQDMSLLGIAQRMANLTARAREGKLAAADVRGGTFTISNHGVSGSLIATPIIINQPQSAILGIGKTEKRVVVREINGADAILIRPMAYVSLTIDHRVVDGHQTNAWLAKFVETLENWPA
jgi:2-oxoglutarate dehydrogenase E2 component (dihydrolipoamide succinyltransferase)